VEGLIAMGLKDIFVAANEIDFEINNNINLNILQIGMDYHSVKEAIIKVNPEIIIVHTPPYFAHVAKFNEFDVIKIAYDHGEPFPSFFNENDRKSRQNIDVAKYNAIKEFHAHISISNFIKRTSGIENSTVIYNGAEHIDHVASRYEINMDIYDYLGIEKNSFVITTLSRIGEGENHYKGFDILKIVKDRLSKLILEKNIVFLIMGKLGQNGSKVKKELEKNGFYVVIDIDDHLKKEILKQSDIFFSPSLWEGFNLPLVEAEYLGIPSIAFSIGSHPEVCPFHFGNINETVQFISSLYKDNKFHKSCAQVCMTFVKNKFKWKDNVCKISSILIDLTEKKRKTKLPLLKYQYSNSIQEFNENNKNILEEHIKRIGYECAVDDGLFTGSFKVRYTVKNNPMISIIIPNKNCFEVLKRCMTSILNKSTYKNFEIIIIENNSSEENIFNYYNKLKIIKNIKIIEWNNPFNYSSINNFGAKHATGEIFLFLNNDVEVINPDWLERLLEHAKRREIGAVGAKLYYPDDTIQHAGVIVGIKGIAGHSHKFYKKDSCGYMGRLQVVQNLSAVTGACLMTRKDVFEEIGGFNDRLPLAFNDVDLCLKMREKGYLIVFTPFAELYHYESLSRGNEESQDKFERSKEVNYIREKWGHVIDRGDPYYNPNLTLDREDFSIGE
jgi:GT2 family glycosyltransferase